MLNARGGERVAGEGDKEIAGCLFHKRRDRGLGCVQLQLEKSIYAVILSPVPGTYVSHRVGPRPKFAAAQSGPSESKSKPCLRLPAKGPSRIDTNGYRFCDANDD